MRSLLTVALFALVPGCNHGDTTGPDGSPRTTALIADHTVCRLTAIPAEGIEAAKARLHIAYGHTSHGSQIVYGMAGLADWKGSLYSFNGGGAGGALDLRDMPFTGASDLGNPDRTAWAAATRAYLAANPSVNVVMWSWCGQVSSATEADIQSYCALMSALERDFPGVTFIYMTGHLDGTGPGGNLHRRNEQIRAYCRNFAKVLFDFADIESYGPDGAFYLDRGANDNCDYDSDANGSLDRNWAIEWQNAHPGEWYSCSAAHSQPLNG